MTRQTADKTAAQLPSSLRATPDLDQWVRFHTDGRVTVATGKVEIGQGIYTAIQVIAADELDVELDRIQVISARTGRTPPEGVTAGSMSIETSGRAVRQACAWARRLVLEKAALHLQVGLSSLSVNDGVITSDQTNAHSDYTSLQGGVAFEFAIAEATEEKAASEYRLIGKGRHLRLDIGAKLRGEPAFVHDLEFDGMLHARIVRAPKPDMSVDGFELTVGPADRLYRNGNFIAVMSPNEARAIALREKAVRLIRWSPGRELDVDVRGRLRDGSAQSFPLIAGVPTDQPVVEISIAHQATYSRPYLMHGSVGPSAAAAFYDGNVMTVWSPSQGIELLRPLLARVLGIGVDDITVIYVQGSGCYGHNGADDVTLDAALAAYGSPGRHVLLKWTRDDEHRFEPYGPAMRVVLGAKLSSSMDRISNWRHEVSSFSHIGRPFPGSSGIDLLAAQEVDPPIPRNVPTPRLGIESGIHRNAAPIYAFDNAAVIKRFVSDSPLRTSALRSLGAQTNVFAIESFMDEMAIAAEMDPVAFRKAHLTDARAVAVMDAALDCAGGLEGPRGLGIARYKNQQTYAAVVCEVEVDEQTALVSVRRVTIAADAGQVIDRDGLINQLEGGAVQALSWCLKEAVQFDADGVTSLDWESYPILRFSEVPEVETVLIDRPELEPLGAGEATQGPTSAALANAVFAATGLRIRDLPMTPDRLRGVAAESASS